MREMTAQVNYALVYDPVKGVYGFDDNTEDDENEESVPIGGAIMEERDSPQLNQLHNVNEEAPPPPPPAPTSDSDLEKITAEDISDYLRSLKLDQYVEEFLENEIDGTALYDIDDDTLESMGVDTKKDRIKIKTRFKHWLRKKAAEIK